KPRPLPTEFAYIIPTAAQRKRIKPDIPIRFIHQGTEPAKWDRLTRFWTLVPAWPGLPLGAPRAEVWIKVPLGLADPTRNIPFSNPPTARKWALGKRLFFDKDFLSPREADRRSCASCHRPEYGFTLNSYQGRDVFKPPSLINCLYNAYQFWDGRAFVLEEVVQRVLEDERPPDE